MTSFLIAEGRGRACNFVVKSESFACTINSNSGRDVASVWVKRE